MGGEAVHAYAAHEVVSVGGTSEIAVDGRDVWATLRDAAAAMLPRAGAVHRGAALELRYVTEPNDEGRTRVRLFLTGKARAPAGSQAPIGEAVTVAEYACAALPKAFETRPADIDLMRGPSSEDDVVVEVRRQEEVLPVLVATVPADFYYAVHPVPGDGSGWPGFLHVLAQMRQPVVVSILISTARIDPVEQETIGVVVSQLRFHSETRQDQNIAGGTTTIQGDANALAVLPIWERHLHELRECFLARITVRGSPHGAPTIARALAHALSGTRVQPTGPRTPLTTQAARERSALERAGHSAAYLDVVPWGGHPFWEDSIAPTSLRRLPYLYTPEEAATLAVLPVPDQHGAPGFPRPRRVTTRRSSLRDVGPDERAVHLGRALHDGYPATGVGVPTSQLPRHTLVVGAPGSGKTTTVLSILAQLWREHRVPFLAIEPTKTEYRTLLDVNGMDQLRIVTLGRDDVAPIRLNPLAPPPGVRCESHIGAVMAVFRAALPLDPPLPQLLEDALERTYELAGWRTHSMSENGLQPPALRDLLRAYEHGFTRHGYAGEIRENLIAALRLRLRSLTRGSRGLLLDTVESVDFDDLMGGPVIVELDEVADREDKAIVAAILLDRIRAAARRRRSQGGGLAHVTVIEEAHRILGRPHGADAETPQTQAIRAFCDAIAELRALGEGFVVSSQSPSALAEAAVANTGVRIVHRLESASDRAMVLADLDASELDRQVAARLGPGEAVVRMPGLEEPEVVRIDAADGVDSGAVIGDADVRKRMHAHTAAVRRLMPYQLCSHEICPAGCDPDIRQSGEIHAHATADAAARIWRDHAGTVAALDPLCAIFAAQAGSGLRAAYCAAAHAAACGDALAVPGMDIRPQVIEAMRTATGSTA